MLDLTQLLSIQIPNWIRVSPSGTQLVYTTTLHLGHKTGEYPKFTIWIADVGKADSARQLTSGLFNDRMPQWNADSTSIAFISDRADAGRSCAIYQFPIGSSGEAVPLTSAENEREISAFEWSPNGKFIAYLSADEKTREKKAKEDEKDDVRVWGEDWEYGRLRLLHVSSKTVTVLVKRDAHVSHLCWNEEGTKIAFTVQETPEEESAYRDGTSLETVSVKGGPATLIYKSEGSVGKDLCWLGDCIYFIAGMSRQHMCSSQAVHSVSVTDSRWTTHFGGEDNCARTLFRCGKSLYVMALDGLEDQIWEVGGDRVFSGMTRIRACHTAVYAPEKGGSPSIVFAMANGSFSTPSEVFTFSRANFSRVKVSNHRHNFELALDEPTPLSVLTRDRKDMLDGLFVSPAKRTNTSKPYPTVVVIHGGPYHRTTNDFMPDMGWDTYLLSAGYAVIFPNYRGGSSRGEEFASYGRNQAGTVDYDDVITITQHCIEKGLADKDNLIVSGWSQGGFLSYLSAVRNGTHGYGWSFKGAICGAGVSDWDAMSMTSDIPFTESAMTGMAPWMADESDITGRRGSALWEIGAAAKAGRIPPVLILHGEKDVRVPVTQAWAFQRGCRQWKVHCEMVTYPREPHPIQERKHLVDVMQRVKKFCDQHIG